VIARIWRGAVRNEDAEEYVAYVRETGVEHYRSTPGDYPEDDRFLVERGPTVDHYEVD
jgi:hypothetical protein